MSFEGAPIPAQESQEDTIKRLRIEIEMAEASYDGERVGKLRAKLETLLVSPADDLEQKYNVIGGDAPNQQSQQVILGQESIVDPASQEVVGGGDSRSHRLFEMQQAVRRGESLTKAQLQFLYFGRSYNTANMNDALEVLDLQSGNTGDKYPEKTKDLRRKANLQNLAVMFDCSDPSRQIATNLNGLFTNRGDIKVFIGDPTNELVDYLEENPEIETRVSFFVEPGEMSGGRVFPLEKITLEDMKRRLGLFSGLPPDHFI